MSIGRDLCTSIQWSPAVESEILQVKLEIGPIAKAAKLADRIDQGGDEWQDSSVQVRRTKKEHLITQSIRIRRSTGRICSSSCDLRRLV
jgi:hypothetical protein